MNKATTFVGGALLASLLVCGGATVGYSITLPKYQQAPTRQEMVASIADLTASMDNQDDQGRAVIKAYGESLYAAVTATGPDRPRALRQVKRASACMHLMVSPKRIESARNAVDGLVASMPGGKALMLSYMRDVSDVPEVEYDQSICS